MGPAAAELDGRPVIISGSDDGTVRVWDLATGTPAGGPFTGHTGPVRAAAAAELDGRPVVISGGADRTVRVWDLARQRAMRHHLHRVRLHHAAPVLVTIAIQYRDRVNLITGCADSVSHVWDLSARRMLSRTIVPGQSGIAAISALAPDHVLYANGSTVFLYEVTGAAAPLLAIELDSKILALATHGTSTSWPPPDSAWSPSKSRTDQRQRHTGISGQKASMPSASRPTGHLTKRTPTKLMALAPHDGHPDRESHTAVTRAGWQGEPIALRNAPWG
jgi:WD40 repeat protein